MKTVLTQGRCFRIREHLPRIRDFMRIKDVPDIAHECHIGIAKHRREIMLLLQPDAMLAGYGASHFNAHFQDAPGQRFAPLQLSWHPSIIEDERVQIAIASMENIRHAEIELARDFADAAEGFAQT